MVETFLIKLLKIIFQHMRTLKKMLLDEAHYKLIAIDLLEQQAIDADLKAIQIIFTGNFDPA